MPETGKFLPTHKVMMIIPPTLWELKTTQVSLSTLPYSITSPNSTPHTFPPPVNNNREVFDEDIIALTLKADWDGELKVSVIIEDLLNLSSKIELVIRIGGVLSISIF